MERPRTEAIDDVGTWGTMLGTGSWANSKSIQRYRTRPGTFTCSSIQIRHVKCVRGGTRGLGFGFGLRLVAHGSRRRRRVLGFDLTTFEGAAAACAAVCERNTRVLVAAGAACGPVAPGRRRGRLATMAAVCGSG